MLLTLQDMVTNLYTTFGYIGILIAMAIESCCIPLPSEIIMPLAGFMVSQHKEGFSLIGVSLAGAIGCVVGSTVAYVIGATGGRELLYRYGKYVLISRQDIDRADTYFAKYGDVTIFVTRLLPVVRTFISLPAGMTRMNFPRFLLFTFVGSLIWCFVLALIGQKLGDHWEDVGGWLHKFDYLVVAIILVLVVLYIRHHLSGMRRGSAAS